MIGGLEGKGALTAYVAIALMEAGEKASSSEAVAYLEEALHEMDDPYTVAITAYALELAQSRRADSAYRMLMELAQEDETGLHWGSSDIIPLKNHFNQSADIENTAYATLALVRHGDVFNASRAAKRTDSRE